MKTRKIILVLLATLIATPAWAVIRNIQDNYKFTYTILDASGNHVGSETATLQIQRASDGFWLDFSDSTFKSSAWTNKTTNLTEDATNGFYHYTYNPPAGETGAEEYIFVVDNASATYGDHQTVAVTYQNIGTSTHAAADIWSVGTRELTALDEDNTTIDLNASAVGSVAGNVGGSVASVTGAVGSVTGNVGGNLVGTIGGLTAGALADFFDTDSGTTYASAVSGSVVSEIADNASGGGGGGTDWTAGEKTLIKQALSIDDGDIDTGESLGGILDRVKKTRP